MAEDRSGMQAASAWRRGIAGRAAAGRLALTLVALGIAAGEGGAMDEFVAGPRALALGGSDVASRVDDTAPHANPALLALPALAGSGRREDEAGAPDGWSIGTTVAGGLHEREFGRLARELRAVDAQRLADQGITSAEDLRGLVRVAGALGGARVSQTAVWGFADGGVAVRIGSVAVGARAHYEAAGYVASIDLQNLGIGVAGPAAANQINGSGAPLDGQVGALSDAQRDNLYGALGGAGAYDPASSAGQAVQRIDFAMRQRGLTGQNASAAVAALQSSLAGSGLSIDQNTSSAIIAGFGLVEVPVSAGFRIGRHVAVGATVSAMVARVYHTRILLFDDAEEALQSVPDQYEQSANVGVDIGGVVRFDRLSIGLVGKDVNQPTFAGPDTPTDQAPDVRVDARVTTTVAWAPLDELLVLGSADLIQATTVMPGHDEQDVSAGLEWEPVRFLALRIGGYKNLAEDDDPFVATGGFGLHLGPVRVDLGAAATFDFDRLLGYRVPRELGTALGVSATF